jgi:hypothetical protein
MIIFMLYTEALFSLGDNELGIQPEGTVGANKSQHMVRALWSYSNIIISNFVAVPLISAHFVVCSGR